MTPYEELLQAAPLAGSWFHSIELAPGLWTNGLKSRETMERELALWRFPDDLTGRSVLDIGCADGAWSVAALRRGARSVLAVDEQITNGMRLIQAADVFPDLKFRQVDLFSDEFMKLGKFDFVIFCGVLYHVHDMLEALKRVRARTDGEVLFETHVNESAGASPPLAVFYETGELDGDRTNWWGPNLACLEAMLRTCGFANDRNHLEWAGEGRRNGRVSYRLQAVEGSISGDVVAGATGSQPHLEWAHGHIDTLSAQNADLTARLAGADRLIAALHGRVSALERSTSWRMTAPLRSVARRLRRSGPSPRT